MAEADRDWIRRHVPSGLLHHAARRGSARCPVRGNVAVFRATLQSWEASIDPLGPPDLALVPQPNSGAAYPKYSISKS